MCVKLVIYWKRLLHSASARSVRPTIPVLKYKHTTCRWMQQHRTHVNQIMPASITWHCGTWQQRSSVERVMKQASNSRQGCALCGKKRLVILPDCQSHRDRAWLCVCMGRRVPVSTFKGCFIRRQLYDHTQNTKFGRNPLVEWSAERRDLDMTTHNTHKRHPCSWRDSNPRSHSANGRRPTSKIARSLGSAVYTGSIFYYYYRQQNGMPNIKITNFSYLTFRGGDRRAWPAGWRSEASYYRTL